MTLDEAHRVGKEIVPMPHAGAGRAANALWVINYEEVVAHLWRPLENPIRPAMRAWLDRELEILWERAAAEAEVGAGVPTALPLAA